MASATAAPAATAKSSASTAVASTVPSAVVTAITTAEVLPAAIVALRIALRRIVLMAEILRRRSIRFRLALVLWLGVLVARFGMGSGFCMDLVGGLLVGFVRAFFAAMLMGVFGLVVRGFRKIAMGTLTVRCVSSLLVVRTAQHFAGQRFDNMSAGGSGR